MKRHSLIICEPFLRIKEDEKYEDRKEWMKYSLVPP